MLDSLATSHTFHAVKCALVLVVAKDMFDGAQEPAAVHFVPAINLQAVGYSGREVSSTAFRILEWLLVQGTLPTVAFRTGCMAGLAQSVGAGQQHRPLWDRAAETAYAYIRHLVDEPRRSPVDTSDGVVTKTVQPPLSSIRHGDVFKHVSSGHTTADWLFDLACVPTGWSHTRRPT